MTASATLVEERALGRVFDRGRIVALRNVSLSISTGETVAVLGHSGSGKSTLVNLLCGLDQPTSGTVFFDGSAVLRQRDWSLLRAARIGIVFQHFHLLPTLSAIENIEVAMLGRLTAHRRHEEASALLDELGIAERADARVFELSGGERQRVAIARALANEPDLVVADEPTGSLDRSSANVILNTLNDLHRRRGSALVLITHDPKVAAFCSRHIELADGCIVADQVDKQNGTDSRL